MAPSNEQTNKQDIFKRVSHIPCHPGYEVQAFRSGVPHVPIWFEFLRWRLHVYIGKSFVAFLRLRCLAPTSSATRGREPQGMCQNPGPGTPACTEQREEIDPGTQTVSGNSAIPLEGRLGPVGNAGMAAWESRGTLLIWRGRPAEQGRAGQGPWLRPLGHCSSQEEGTPNRSSWETRREEFQPQSHLSLHISLGKPPQGTRKVTSEKTL